MIVAPRSARADGFFVNPGVVTSVSAGPSPAVGIGAEVSTMFYRGKYVEDSFGHGAFVQAQLYGGDHGRYAGGYQFGSFLGGEIGFAYRDSSSTRSWTAGPHLGAFASLGFVSLGLRGVIPLFYDANATNRPHYGEIGAFLTLKWPIGVGDITATKSKITGDGGMRLDF